MPDTESRLDRIERIIERLAEQELAFRAHQERLWARLESRFADAAVRLAILRAPLDDEPYTEEQQPRRRHPPRTSAPRIRPLVKLHFTWSPQALAAIRQADREAALRILPALTRLAQSGEGDVKHLSRRRGPRSGLSRLAQSGEGDVKHLSRRRGPRSGLSPGSRRGLAPESSPLRR